jgi:glycosyltransferase involved in cell wall biosynthesis
MIDFTGMADPHAEVRIEALAGASVLQIVPALDRGPAGRETIEIAAQLAEVGARSLVASEGGGLVGELQARGGLWVPFAAGSANPLTVWRNGARLARIVEEERIDLVHARGLAPAWSFRGAPGRHKRPVVQTFDGLIPPTGPIARRVALAMRDANAVIAPSRASADLLVAIWPDAAERVRIVPKGVDLAAFSAASVRFERVEALRAEWGLLAGERLVLMPCFGSEADGHDLFLEAAAMLRNAGVDDTVFLVCDDGRSPRLTAALDHIIEAAGLKEAVKRVPAPQDRAAAFLAASAVVFPSPGPDESTEPAAEAQAMGCPIIASDACAGGEVVLAPPEVPDRARTGWRVPAGNPGALAEAVSDALALGASARDALSLRARAHAERHHSLAAMCRGTLAVYAALLSKAV